MILLLCPRADDPALMAFASYLEANAVPYEYCVDLTALRFGVALGPGGATRIRLRLRSCGFRVPRSLLTNDEAQARAFLDEVGEAVFKGASGEKTIASAYGPESRARLPLLPASPVLFQQRIAGADVRAHLVGATLIAERIESDGVNYQYSRAPVAFAPTVVPPDIARRCLAYQELSGLAFIGFDFMVTDAGEHVVLEANPMPGYDVFDHRLGHAISGALLALLGPAG